MKRTVAAQCHEAIRKGVCDVTGNTITVVDAYHLAFGIKSAFLADLFSWLACRTSLFDVRRCRVAEQSRREAIMFDDNGGELTSTCHSTINITDENIQRRQYHP